MKKEKEINNKEKITNESTVYVGFTKKELEHFRRINTRGKTVKKIK